MRLLFALLLISTTALCQQKPLELKVNKADSLKLEMITTELKKNEEIIKRVEFLQAIKATIIESQFNNRDLPFPQRFEYSNGVILYLNDEKKTTK